MIAPSRLFLLTITIFISLLTGCLRRRPAQPAPPPFAPVMVSVPPPTHHDDGEPIAEPQPEPSLPSVQPVPLPSKPKRSKKPSAGKPAIATPSSTPSAPNLSVNPAATASSATTTESSALGQLTVGGENDEATKQQTASFIKSTEQSLDALPQSIQASHTAQIIQVRYFLKQGSDAFKIGDIQGARTLTTKARVLLDDIQR